MRKNIFNTVAGLLVAVSMLFAAIGCTNINDPDTLKNDSFTVNKMAIAGFKVSGLDGVFDHATVQLKGADDAVIAEGIIADEEATLTPGTAFVKLATPYIFDAGENSPKDFECYLEVVKSGITLAKIQAVDSEDLTAVANAKLPIVPSPYGTKDADLAKRYVDVQVSNGIGTFSFVEDSSASLRFSYTALPEMTGEALLALTEADGVKVETKAKADAEFASYTITVNNLENDEDGMRYVVTGATIGSSKATAGDHWNAYADNNADEGLISEVKEGSVTFNFVGKEPSWNTGKGVAIKIAAIDDPMKSDPWLCLLAAPNNGNFCIPCDKDYTITIDAKKLNAEYKAASVKERFVKVMNLTVVGTKLKEIEEAGESEYLAFCEAWLPKNEWGAKTPNKVEIDKIVIDGDVGSATLSLGKGVDFWAGEPYTFVDMPMQIVYPESDDAFWNNKLMEAGFKVYFEDKWIGKAVNIIYDLDDKVATVESGKVIKVIGYKLINIPVEREGQTLYVHGQSSDGEQPGNAWDDSTPHKGVVTDGEVTIEFAPENIWTLTDEANVQVIATHWDDKVVAGDMGGFDTDNFADTELDGEYWIEIDCTAKELCFVTE